MKKIFLFYILIFCSNGHTGVCSKLTLNIKQNKAETNLINLRIQEEKNAVSDLSEIIKGIKSEALYSWTIASGTTFGLALFAQFIPASKGIKTTVINPLNKAFYIAASAFAGFASVNYLSNDWNAKISADMLEDQLFNHAVGMPKCNSKMNGKSMLDIMNNQIVQIYKNADLDMGLTSFKGIIARLNTGGTQISTLQAIVAIHLLKLKVLYFMKSELEVESALMAHLNS